MKILSIEGTPNPNSAKIVVDESLPPGESHSYTAANKNDGPPFIQKILEVPGVEGIYHVMNFLSIQKSPMEEWDVILPPDQQAFED
jgi:hypothetical protein